MREKKKKWKLYIFVKIIGDKEYITLFFKGFYSCET